jgi:ribosomal protein L13E
MATRLGIAVDNADLGVIVSDERRRLREPQSVPSLQTESHCPTNTRSRGPER